MAVKKKAELDATDLAQYIPRPVRVSEKRKMLSIYREDYDQISDLAIKLDTSRGRVLTALLAFYTDEPQG